MNDVPRGTPPVPDTARGVFSSDTLPLAIRYAELLASDGVVRGLIGPREVPRLWDRHLLNSFGIAPALPPGSRVADVGSGAGLPGIVLAIGRPDLHLTLIEPLLRRTTFLAQVVGELGLGNVTVVRARAEEVHGASVFDVVTSRAVAPLGRLLEWCMPLVGADGQVLALKGASAADEVRAVRPLLGRHGWAPPELVVVGPDGVRPAAVEVEPTEPVPGQVVGASGGSSTVRAVRVRWADPAQVSSSSIGSRHRSDGAPGRGPRRGTPAGGRRGRGDRGRAGR